MGDNVLLWACWARFARDRGMGWDWTPDNFNCTVRDVGGARRCPVADECRVFLADTGTDAPKVAEWEREKYMAWWRKVETNRGRKRFLGGEEK